MLREKKVVGSRWIFFVKFKSNSSVERCKARLIAKGCTQTYDIDYLKTFDPGAKINTIQVMLLLAINLGWNLQQYDARNVFL